MAVPGDKSRRGNDVTSRVRDSRSDATRASSALSAPSGRLAWPTFLLRDVYPSSQILWSSFDFSSQWLAETRQEHHVGEDEEGEDSLGLGIVEVEVEDAEEAEEELRMIPRFNPNGKMTAPRWLSDSNKYGSKTRWTRSLGLPDYKRELRRKDG